MSVSPAAAVLIWAVPNEASPVPPVVAVEPASSGPADELSATVTPLAGTELPNWSCTWTVTVGVSAAPASDSAGFWAKASLLAVAG